MQFALFYNSNAETYWHIVEHLIVRTPDNYVFTYGHTGPRYSRFKVGSKLRDADSLISHTNIHSIPKSRITNELQAVIGEYIADRGKQNFALRYQAMFGLSYAEMLKRQKLIADSFVITVQELNSIISQLHPLNTKNDIEKINEYVSHTIPTQLQDPPLKLKNGTIYDKSEFAFVKRCLNYADAKSTKFLIYQLEDTGMISNVQYFGIIDKYLLITGKVEKLAAHKELEKLQEFKILNLLPPFGRPGRRDLVNETELKLAFK